MHCQIAVNGFVQVFSNTIAKQISSLTLFFVFFFLPPMATNRFSINANNAALFVRFERMRARLIHLDNALLPHWQAQAATLRARSADQSWLYVGRVFVQPNADELSHAQSQVDALRAERVLLVRDLSALEDALLRTVVSQSAFTKQ